MHVNKHRSKFTKGFVVIKLQWSPYFSFHFEDEKIVLRSKNSSNRKYKEHLIIQQRVVTVGMKKQKNKYEDFMKRILKHCRSIVQTDPLTLPCWSAVDMTFIWNFEAVLETSYMMKTGASWKRRFHWNIVETVSKETAVYVGYAVWCCRCPPPRWSDANNIPSVNFT